MVDIAGWGSTGATALLLLVFIGTGAYVLGEQVGLNPKFLGIIGCAVALYIIYQAHQ